MELPATLGYNLPVGCSPTPFYICCTPKLSIGLEFEAFSGTLGQIAHVACLTKANPLLMQFLRTMTNIFGPMYVSKAACCTLEYR
jgi:hypothetical protein